METQDEAEFCFPHLNTSCRKPAQSDEVILHIVLSFIMVLTVILNLLVIISVSHFRQLHTPTNILLLSLAVSDCLQGLLIMPGDIYLNTSCWFFGDLACSLCLYLSFTISSASVGDMVLISIDRYLAICHPLHYSVRVTARRVKVCVCLCWLCSVLYNLIFLQENLTQQDRHRSCYGECVISTHPIAGTADLVITFIAPVTVIVVLYVRVFVVAVSQARAMRSHIAANTLQHSVTAKTRKSELKAARTLGVIVLMFLMCLCPYYCVSFVGDGLMKSFLISIFYFLFNLNSCINPVIYALFYTWFRKALKLIITFQILYHGSREINVL